MQGIHQAKILFLFSALLITGCNAQKKNLFMPDSTRWTDQDIPLDELDTGRVNVDSTRIMEEMRKTFSVSDSLIEGRPASYFLGREDVSTVAKQFYLLRFIPSDDSPSYSLCDSLLASNDTTRSFYYFLFQRLRKISDGALSERMTNVATRFALSYPDEFYWRLRLPAYRSSYGLWVEDFANAVPNLRKSDGSPVSSADELHSYIAEGQLRNLRKRSAGLRREIDTFADSIVAHSSFAP